MINDILQELKNNPSILVKKDIIEKHKDNEVFRKVLFLALDPSIVFNIKKIPPIINIEEEQDLDTVLDNLANIYNRKYTGHAALNYLSTQMGSLSEEDASVVMKVVMKDLDCGVQEKIVNKIIPGFIKDEPYMRCSLVDTKTIKKIRSFKTHGYAVSEVKMDGQYLNTAIVNDSVLCTSRNGKVYDFLGFLDDEVIKLSKFIQESDTRFKSGVVIMGECLATDEDGNILNRETSNGIVQKAGKASISTEEAVGIILVVWDVVPYDKFMEREWKVPRKERREILENAIKNTNNSKVRMVKYKIVKNITEAFQYNAEVMGEDEEGTILKCELGEWKSHTSPYQLKMKLKMQFDLRIVGFKEGKKKRAGTLGAIMLESDDGIISSGVGTGIKEKDHEWTLDKIWEAKDYLMGKIVTVEVTSLTIDKRTGKKKLFLPVFIEFRFDKDTADNYDRILEIEESAIEVLMHSLIEAFS